MALFSAMGVMLVVLLLVSVTFTIVLANQRQAYQYADNAAALAAAEAGVDDYLARLNRVPGYWATFSESSPGDNASLDGWAQVPGSVGEYHVDADGGTASASGGVVVRSTGRVGDEVRTIETTLRADGFLDYIYFTQHEALDPLLTGRDPALCDRLHSEGRDDADCGGVIRFVTGDVIDGPLHSNDAIVIDGRPHFRARATTAWQGPSGSYQGCSDATNRLWRENGTNSQPRFDGGLCHRSTLPVPADNQQLQDVTTHSSPATRGCAYYGPTYIRFYDPDPAVDNDGRMVVRSPLSVVEPPGAIPKNDTHCGSDAALASPRGADLPIPPNGVVYVDDHPTASCTDASHPLDLPRDRDATGYACDEGDAFVWGTVDGQVTVGTRHDINIVWDLVYAEGFPDTNDLTGLVANRNVQLYHPVTSGRGGRFGRGVNLPKFGTDRFGRNLPPFIAGDLPTATDPTHPDPTIHAAIMAVRHSFRVQNHNRGEPYDDGALSVRGAIAQYFRGPVGTSFRTGTRLTGYEKDYVYDDRLGHLSPPYFTQPSGETSWRERSWAEVRPPADLPG